MLLFTRGELTSRSKNEISSLIGEFIKAGEQLEPFSPEWRFVQHLIDSAQRERSRRLRRISPGWR